MASTEILLAEEQRLEFTQIPQNISEWEIARHYTLTEGDIEIINRHRRNYNRLGFAVQLCVLRNPGWSLSNTQEIQNFRIQLPVRSKFLLEVYYLHLIVYLPLTQVIDLILQHNAPTPIFNIEYFQPY